MLFGSTFAKIKTENWYILNATLPTILCNFLDSQVMAVFGVHITRGISLLKGIGNFEGA